MSETLGEKRREVIQDYNVIEVGLTTGESFRIQRGSYHEHDSKDVGTGGVVSFMLQESNKLGLTYVQNIGYVVYFVPSGYAEEY